MRLVTSRLATNGKQSEMAEKKTSRVTVWLPESLEVELMRRAACVAKSYEPNRQASMARPALFVTVVGIANEPLCSTVNKNPALEWLAGRAGWN